MTTLAKLLPDGGLLGFRDVDSVQDPGAYAAFLDQFAASFCEMIATGLDLLRLEAGASVFDLGCVVYFAVPTAPPWWAAEQKVTDEEVRRIMVEVGEGTWRSAWPKMYEALGGNPWAAMPSLHFATSVQAALSLSEVGRKEGALGWGYASTLGFALVYLGEHYVTDLIAGAFLVAAVRRGEKLAEPLVLGVNGALQRFERIASK